MKGYCRQTMIGGNYGLLQIEGDDIRVNPDFYAAHLFHRIMGDSILDSNVTVRSSAFYKIKYI